MLKFLAYLSGRVVGGVAEAELLRNAKNTCKVLNAAGRLGVCRGGDVRLSVFSAKGPREVNEDSAVVALAEGAALVAVADGVGGIERGERASAAAICAVLSAFAENLSQRPDSWLGWAFDDAHRVVQRSAEGGATTLTVAVLSRWGVYGANVGDSPLYVAAPNLRLVTTNLDEEGGYITQAVGHSSYSGPHMYRVEPIHHGAVFAVTDGVDDTLASRYPAVLSNVLKKGGGAYELARGLVCSALRAGARDNATASVALIRRPFY